MNLTLGGGGLSIKLQGRRARCVQWLVAGDTFRKSSMRTHLCCYSVDFSMLDFLLRYFYFKNYIVLETILHLGFRRQFPQSGTN